MTRGARLCLLSTVFLWLGCAQRVASHAATTEPAERRPRAVTTSTLAAPSTSDLVQTQITESDQEQPESPSPSSAGSESEARSANAHTVALEVPEFSPAVLRLPEGDGQAPILVVAHGAGGTPEAHCELWARISQARAILLCLRGRARSPLAADGAYYPDHPALERETFAALSALRARFAERIATGPVFYAGFSQGATMGALMLVEHASEVTRLVLVEGGFAEWNVARARDFRARGGERVLFVCGRKECAEPARNAAHWFNEAGVAARLEYVVGAGHSHDTRVEARIARLFPWFVEGDARWQTSAGLVSANTPK